LRGSSFRVPRPAERDHVRDDGFAQRGRPIEEARQHQRGGEDDQVQQQSERERGTAGIRPCGASRLRGALSLKAVSAPDPDR